MPARPNATTISLHGVLAAISTMITSALYVVVCSLGLVLLTVSELRPHRNFLFALIDRHTEKPQHNRQAHPYRPSRPGDDRSPCPALNALANHGYL